MLPSELDLIEDPPVPLSPPVFLRSSLSPPLPPPSPIDILTAAAIFQVRIWHPTCFPSSFDCFFSFTFEIPMTSWLERGMRKKKKAQNSRKRALNGRMPTPSSCRVPTRLRCSGPISSLRSIYLRACQIWPRRSTFHRGAFWRKYNVSGKKRRGFYCLLRFIIEQWPPPSLTAWQT